MTWKENKWIKFLEGYCKGKNQIQDEYVRKVASQLNVDPLEINFPWQEEILLKFKSNEKPKLIILTGTAGDGKTKLCRDIVKSLDGQFFDEGKWNENSFFSSAQRIIVKDFSELNKKEKSEIIEELLLALEMGYVDKPILIAVNDGILIESLDDYIREIENPDKKEKLNKIKNIIEDKINLDFSYIDGSDVFNLINLSKLNAKSNIELIVNTIVGSDNWDECNGCAGKEERKCAIYNKYETLKNNKNVLKNLSDIILLLQLNNEHFTIRELLNLSVNTLLASTPKHKSLILNGYSSKKETFDCKSMQLISSKDIKNLEVESTIEVGFWGMNVGINKMKDSRPYSEINRLGFGDISTNYWDSKIISESKRDFIIPIDSFKNKNEQSENYDVFIKRARIQLYCYQNNDAQAYDLQKYPAFYKYYNEIYKPLAEGRKSINNIKTIENIVLALNRVFHGRYISRESGGNKLYVPQEGLGSLIPISIFHGYDINEENLVIENNNTDAKALSGSRIEPYLTINTDESSSRLFKISFPIDLYDFLIKVANGAPPNTANPRLYKKLLILRSRLSTLKKGKRVQVYMIDKGSFKSMALEVGV